MINLDKRDYSRDTSVTSESPWGWYRTARVMCADGKVRTVARISQTADTFYSVPCAVKVNGKTVAGYLTTETEQGFTTDLSLYGLDDSTDPTIALFIAYSYGKNASELPAGRWRPPTS